MAATANDVARAWADLHEKRAKEIARQPTGVTPGYNPRLGATITEDGRLRYVRGANTGDTLTETMVLARVSHTQTVPGDGEDLRVNFNSKTFDPYGCVRTGPAWVFTMPIPGGIITASVWVAIEIGDLGWGATDVIELAGLSTSENRTIDRFSGIEIASGFPQQITLGGEEYFEMEAGDELYFLVGQDSGLQRDVITSQTRIIIRRTGFDTGIAAEFPPPPEGLGDQATGHATGTRSMPILGAYEELAVTGLYPGSDTDPYTQMFGSVFYTSVAMTVDVTASIATTGMTTWAAGQGLTLEVRVNGSPVATLDSQFGPDTGNFSLSGTATGLVLAAETALEIWAVGESTTDFTITLSSSGTFSIDRTV